jgi:hypothetical protein
MYAFMAWTETALPFYTENPLSEFICSCHFSLDAIYIKLRSNRLAVILGLPEPEDERVRAFEASGTTGSTTQCHIAENLNLQLHLCENLISCRLSVFSNKMFIIQRGL